MQINAYLNFDGQCAAAFRFYEQLLGGKIERMMTTTRNSVPQRGCAVGYLRTASVVSGSPARR